MPGLHTTMKPQEGTWTLTAPDGRKWEAKSPLECAGIEQRERVPPRVAVQRIVAAMESYDAELVRRMTAAMREADETFERVGGSTRDHIRDCLLPVLAKHGLELGFLTDELVTKP